MLGSRTQFRCSGRGKLPRRLSARRRARYRARPCRARRRERPDPDRGGTSSGGSESQESTDGWPHPGQGMGLLRNGLPRGAKLRSGRAGRLPASPVSTGRERYVRRTSCVEATGLAITGNRRHDSGVPAHLRVGRSGQRARLGGERDREASAATAPAAIEREPAREQRPARAGTASREGKAL